MREKEKGKSNSVCVLIFLSFVSNMVLQGILVMLFVLSIL